MLPRLSSPRLAALLIAAGSGLALAGAPTAAFASSGHHQAPNHDIKLNQVNLASDIPGLAPLTDPDLVNPWGISHAPTSPLWVSNQGTNSSTLYTLTPGSSTVTKVPTVRVTMAGSVAGPTGQVNNTGTGFVLSNGTVSAPAAFIFATLDGHIEAWNPMVDPLIGNAEDKATVPGAGYTGLAIASTRQGDRLFAANFAQGRIDVFDSAFHQVKTARWQFRDPRLPRGYLPFNTQTLNGDIFVAYDKADPVTHRQAVGRGLGVVDEFSPDGHLISRITSGGALNAPWGLAIAPAGWVMRPARCWSVTSVTVGSTFWPSKEITSRTGSPAWSGTSPRASRSPSQACGACCPVRRPTVAPTRCGSPRASTTSRTACSASCAPNTTHALSRIAHTG